MSPTDKKVSRVSLLDHSRHKRKIIITVGPGDVLGLRLAHAKADTTAYLPLEAVFDLADRRRAEAQAGFSAGPCNNPKTIRNV